MLKLEKSWKKHLEAEFNKPYIKKLKQFLATQAEIEKTVYPETHEIFNAFKTTPFDEVKVVVLGQDPYHGPDQAHGLSFSVKKGIKIPPSLMNIYKELKSDIGIETPLHGELTKWAEQGVLLLNSSLTVEEAKAGSHRNQGWEQFTDKVIEVLNSEKENLVFLLWGSPAQKKASKVDTKKHLVLKSPHPSPLSAYRGFFGCKHFSQTNTYLKQNGKSEINWSLS